MHRLLYGWPGRFSVRTRWLLVAVRILIAYAFLFLIIPPVVRQWLPRGDLLLIPTSRGQYTLAAVVASVLLFTVMLILMQGRSDHRGRAGVTTTTYWLSQVQRSGWHGRGDRKHRQAGSLRESCNHPSLPGLQNLQPMSFQCWSWSWARKTRTATANSARYARPQVLQYRRQGPPRRVVRDEDAELLVGEEGGGRVHGVAAIRILVAVAL